MVADSITGADPGSTRAQAAQANSEAENPALASYWMPKALIFERVARETVSSEPAGWKIPVSFAGSPVSTPNGTTSSISKSTSSPIRTECVRPSSLHLDRQPLDAQVLADQRPQRLHRTAERPREDAAELLRLLVGCRPRR